LYFASGGAMMPTLIEAYLNLIVSNLALIFGLARQVSEIHNHERSSFSLECSRALADR